MLEPSSALIIYLRVLQFLDTSANTLEKLGRAVETSQDVIDVEYAAQDLKDVEARENTSKTRPTGENNLGIRLTEPEKAVQSVYERAKTFADRLLPALQSFSRTGASSSSKSSDGARKDKSETEKWQKDLETIRLDCARSLTQLLS